MQCLWMRGENIHHGDLLYSTECCKKHYFKNVCEIISSFQPTAAPGPPALVKPVAPLPVLAGSHAIPAVPTLLSPTQDTAPHPSPQQHPLWARSSRPTYFSLVRYRIPQHHRGWLGLGPALSLPPVPAGPTPALSARAPHAGPHCSTETLQNPHNSFFPTSNFLFLCAHGTQRAQSPMSPAQPTWDRQEPAAAGSGDPCGRPAGRGEHTMPGAGIPQGWGQGGSGMSRCHGCHHVPAWPEAVGNGLTLMFLLAQASPKAPGPDPCVVSPPRERQPGDAGTAEVPPSTVPSVAGT